MKLAQEIPQGEKDLFFTFDEVIDYIKNRNRVKIIIAHLYEIDVKYAKAEVIGFEYDCVVMQLGDTRIIIPNHKMYRIGRGGYLEIIDGIDYSRDILNGDIIRSH